LKLNREPIGIRFEVRKAKFYTTPDLHKTNLLKLQSMTLKWVDKFIAGEGKVGWELVGKPLVRRINIVDEHDIGPSRVSDIGGLWHPYMMTQFNIISSDHPFVHPGKDLYMIWAPMKMPCIPHIIEIADEIIREGKLPKGLKIL